MLKLKLQHFVHLIRSTDSLEKTLMLGKIEGRRRRGQQRMRWLDGITNSMGMSLSIVHPNRLQNSSSLSSLLVCKLCIFVSFASICQLPFLVCPSIEL